MFRSIAGAAALLALAGCATRPTTVAPVAPPASVEVQILAFNDFHGNLEPPPPVEVTEADGSKRRIQTGGVANLAGALTQLRAGHPNTVTVSAGDTISASPLISANYLDEPTIKAMNLLGLEFNSVGNHEFDQGPDELKRMQNGGCAKFTRRTPCAVGPFAGATFRILPPMCSVRRLHDFPRDRDQALRPAHARFHRHDAEGDADPRLPVRRDGLEFADEAATANALVPKVKAEGADAIVLLIYQPGGSIRAGTRRSVPCSPLALRATFCPILAQARSGNPAGWSRAALHNAYISPGSAGAGRIQSAS